MNSMVNNEATHLLLPILKETLTNLTEFHPSRNPMRAKTPAKIQSEKFFNLIVVQKGLQYYKMAYMASRRQDNKITQQRWQKNMGS